MAHLDIVNPADHSLVRRVEADDAASVAKRYQHARAAQPAWALRPLAERITVLSAFRELLVSRKEELAKILTQEVGKPIRQSRNELGGVIARIDFCLENAPRAVSDERVLEEGGMTEIISHEPLGVIANISAWNYPYLVGANVFVPALLTGNAVLYKPSELATLTGLEIGRMLHEAGVPKEIFAVLVGGGDVGAALLEQEIDGVFFTGSYATGKRVAEAVASRLVKVQLELGGKDPVYVAEDVDVAKAAESLADGAFYNAGQSCCAVERIYVHAAIHDAFVEAFVANVKGFVSGAPTDEATYVGPLTRAPQIKVLEDQVADATAKGATVLTGGKALRGPGNYFEPTVLSHVDHTMKVMRDESFGPIIGIQKVGSDAEAQTLMNDTEYGLTAGIYTTDESRAKAILRGVDAGSVYWNCCDRVSPRLPWSGVGHSGMGLTLSTYGIQAFTRTKAWHLRSP